MDCFVVTVVSSVAVHLDMIEQESRLTLFSDQQGVVWLVGWFCCYSFKVGLG